jgi:hypothetical protein
VAYYSPSLISKVRGLRTLGKTYPEIIEDIKTKIPKSTLSSWCKNITLPQEYSPKLKELNRSNLRKARKKALLVNKLKRVNLLEKLVKDNLTTAKTITNKQVAKIALAMLCLGEASKYNTKTGRNFYLGSSNSKIIVLFLELLKICFNFNINKVRCTIQCRADQDIDSLEKYWQKITKIPKRLFYPSRIDPRTNNKPTLNKNYKGVLRVDYFDSKIHLELETLANLIYNRIS